MKVPQIMVDRLKSITTEHKAQHIANIIELANADKIKKDFDVTTHIANVLIDDNITDKQLINFDYEAIKKPITRQLTEATKEKRYNIHLKKLQEKYGIKAE